MVVDRDVQRPSMITYWVVIVMECSDVGVIGPVAQNYA